MALDTIFIVLTLFIGFFVIYLLLKQQLTQSRNDPTLYSWLKSLQQSFDLNNRNTNLSLQKNYQELFARLDQATAVISDLKKEAGAFGEVSRSMKDMQDYLRSPKLRGNIGEQVLTDLISQIFPVESYRFQYHFKSGQIVDAAIITKGGILPIDSKFPMENFQRIYSSATQMEKNQARSSFNRDIKKHVKDISSKYILAEEGTLDFALMYVPSESVYYEMVSDVELLDYSREMRVYPVSPTTLYASLQTILLSLEGQKLAEKSKEVMIILRSVSKDYEKMSDNMSTLGRHITNAYNSLAETNNLFSRLGQKLDSVKEIKSNTLDK